MTPYKLVTEVVPKKIQVLITYPNCPLGKEIIRQLQIHSHLEIVTSEDPSVTIPDLPSLGVVLHLAGFASPSLSETLSYTTVLYKLLSLSHSSQAQFFLVLANTHNHLYHTAITLVGQFAKNFPTTYQILEIDKTTSVPNTATEIIRKFVHGHKLPLTPVHLSPISPPRDRSPRKLHLPHPKWPLIILAIIIIPWSLFIIQVGILAGFFLCSLNSLRSLNLYRASSCAQISLSLSSVLSFEKYLVLGSEPIFTRLGIPPSSGLNLVTGLSKNIINIADTNKYYSDQVSKFLDLSSGTPDLLSIDSKLSTISESLSQYQSDLRTLYLGRFRPARLLTNIAEVVSRLRDTVSQSQVFVNDLPLLLSISRHTNYLILFQDSTKLDSFVYLTAENGKIVNVELSTVKSADSQLRGQVTPPPDFKSTTGQTQWYLRDSNWDPDFPTTAKRVAWFIDKELSRPVDIAIIMNLHSLSQTLSAIGPIFIPDLNLTVSADTMEDQYLVYLKDHPQSDQFIFKVAEKILDQIKSLDSLGLQQLNLNLLGQLASRQIFIYPLSTPTSSLSQLGWSGGVGSPVCRSTQTCVSDYFYLTNTNLGDNKAEAYISSTLTLSTKLELKKINTVLNISYNNPSTPTTWPAGTFKNYLRLYFSPNNIVNSISINGEIISPARYSVTDSLGLKLLSLTLEVAQGRSSQVTVDLTQSLSQTQFHYQLDMPNQPGASSSSLNIEVSYPKSWFATALNTGVSLTPAVASPGRLGYNTATTGNSSVDIDFTIPD